MRTRILMYHDVVPPGAADGSGFPGAGAAHYKIDPEAFREQLDLLLALPRKTAIVTLPELLDRHATDDAVALLLTFDDGGASAWEQIAPELESRGLRGHFFIATDWLGKPGFLTPEQVLDLSRRGHVIGTHSASHPARISRLPESEIAAEWRRSVALLNEILAAPVGVGSIPGGHYSRAVARAATAAGVRHLFSSEPSAGSWTAGGCEVFGRYAVHRRTSMETVRGYAAGATRYTAPEWAAWQLKKAGKRLAGPIYDALRAALLGAEQRHRDRSPDTARALLPGVRR